MSTVFIYALLDPDTKKVRYVGKAKNPKNRLKQHMWRARGVSDNMHVHNWIRKLEQFGKRPELEVLDEVSAAEWEFWEREYIRVFRAIGFNLTNTSDGGDYAFDWTGKKQSPETIENRVSKLRGRPLSAEHRATISKAKRGIPPSAKTITASIRPEVLARRSATRRANSLRKRLTAASNGGSICA